MVFFLWSVCVWVCVGLEDIWITFTESEWHTGPIPDTWFTNKFTMYSVLNLHYIIFPSQQIRNPWLAIGKMRLHVLHRISKIPSYFCEILRINVQYCKEPSQPTLFLEINWQIFNFDEYMLIPVCTCNMKTKLSMT